jgi:hypothetical protein
MLIAILSEDKPGFIQPMSLGLEKMLAALGVKAKIFPQGLVMLNYTPSQKVKNLLKKTINRVKPGRFLVPQTVSLSKVTAFETELMAFDMIVVVCPLPTSFDKSALRRIEHIRQSSNMPIVLYQNYYLATRGSWSKKIFAASGFGLERYDWYLAASLVSEYPLTGKGHPVSTIGHDLRDGSLFIEPDKLNGKPYKVLLDFERKGFEQYRQLQIQALQETDTEYTQLKGRYSMAEIRAVYRAHSALFLSSRESFCLPIVENQLCGNDIFIPFKIWTPSHFINKPVDELGEGGLGDNFKVYDQCLQTLKALIQQCKSDYQPQQRLARFKQDYPQLYQGDLIALQSLLDKVSSKAVTGDSHTLYKQLNETIISGD